MQIIDVIDVEKKWFIQVWNAILKTLDYLLKTFFYSKL